MSQSCPHLLIATRRVLSISQSNNLLTAHPDAPDMLMACCFHMVAGAKVGLLGGLSLFPWLSWVQRIALISLQQRGWPLKNATNILTSMDKFVTAVLRTVGDRDQGGADNNVSSKRRALKKRLEKTPNRSYGFGYALSCIAYPAQFGPCHPCSNLYTCLFFFLL